MAEEELCQFDTIPPVWFSWKHRCEYEQGLGWDRICEVQRSNESPGGTFKRQNGLR